MPEKNLEDNLVEALLTAANYRSPEEYPVVIKRGEKELFRFTIRAVDEDSWRRALKENTQNRGRRSEELDVFRYLSQVIYSATVEEDRERIWKNKTVWQKLNVASGVDCVNAVLSPAEKQVLASKIEKISGYDETTLDDIISK